MANRQGKRKGILLCAPELTEREENMSLDLIFIELLLFCVGALFLLGLISRVRAFFAIKKRYALAPEKITDGHRVQTTRDVHMCALCKCKADIFGYSIALFVTVFMAAFIWR